MEADIPWKELGLVAQSGLKLDLTASVTAMGISESEPALELSWRYFRRIDDRMGLGTVQLMP
jgi:hypothetical protein